MGAAGVWRCSCGSFCEVCGGVALIVEKFMLCVGSFLLVCGGRWEAPETTVDIEIRE